MQQDDHDNISAQEVKHLLLDLMMLSGQTISARPALELQIGNVLTRTSVEVAGSDLYLSVTGLLPPCGSSHYLPSISLPAAVTADSKSSIDFLWHADEGRYIVTRKIPLDTLSDERSVMEEILTTADITSRCLDAIHIQPPVR